MDLSTGTSTDPFYLVKDDIQASVSVPARNFCLAKKNVRGLLSGFRGVSSAGSTVCRGFRCFLETEPDSRLTKFDFPSSAVKLCEMRVCKLSRHGICIWEVEAPIVVSNLVLHLS
jgi:hypothetical protein